MVMGVGKAAGKVDSAGPADRRRRTYYHTVVACRFAKLGQVRLVQVVKTTLPIGVVEDVEVVGISVIGVKNIDNGIQE